MTAIIFKSRFVISSSDKFNSYIAFINRDEAVRNNDFNR